MAEKEAVEREREALRRDNANLLDESVWAQQQWQTIASGNPSAPEIDAEYERMAQAGMKAKPPQHIAAAGKAPVAGGAPPKTHAPQGDRRPEQDAKLVALATDILGTSQAPTDDPRLD